MKYLFITLSIFASSALCADNHSKEIIEKDINTIPQCKDQTSEECKEIKQQINEFCELIDAGNIVLELSSLYDPDFKEVIKAFNYETIKAITLYIESQKRTEEKMSFKQFIENYATK